MIDKLLITIFSLVLTSSVFSEDFRPLFEYKESYVSSNAKNINKIDFKEISNSDDFILIYQTLGMCIAANAFYTESIKGSKHEELLLKIYKGKAERYAAIAASLGAVYKKAKRHEGEVENGAMEMYGYINEQENKVEKTNTGPGGYLTDINTECFSTFGDKLKILLDML